MAERVDKAVPNPRESEKMILVETEGYLETYRFLKKIPDKKNLFEWVWSQRITGVSVRVVPTIRPKNEVHIVGKVRNVWKNADPGKRFYSITMDDGNADRKDGDKFHVFTLIYFDYKMDLEPVVGETLKCEASIHTRTLVHDGRRETDFTVNAWRIIRANETSDVVDVVSDDYE
jgi:hypothetical protein